jgi:hypothetical protein
MPCDTENGINNYAETRQFATYSLISRHSMAFNSEDEDEDEDTDEDDDDESDDDGDDDDDGNKNNGDDDDGDDDDKRLRRDMKFVETRNVLVYDSASKVAGFHQNGGILTRAFLRWLSYVLDVPAPFRLALRNADPAGEPVREDQVLAPGEYDIVSAGASASFETFSTPQAPMFLVDGLPLSTLPRADVNPIPRFSLRDEPGSESVSVYSAGSAVAYDCTTINRTNFSATLCTSVTESAAPSLRRQPI